jgi:hypothetical protein
VGEACGMHGCHMKRFGCKREGKRQHEIQPRRENTKRAIENFGLRMLPEFVRAVNMVVNLKVS